MSSDAASNIPPSFDGVVNDDGSVTISPDQVATLRLRPGSHLRLVARPPRQSLAELSEQNAAWQRERGTPDLSDEEAGRNAEAAREARRQLAGHEKR